MNSSIEVNVKCLISVLSIFLFSLTVSAENLQTDDKQKAQISVCQTEEAKYGFRIELANLLLKKTASYYGKAHLAPFREETLSISQDRCMVLLEQQKVDVLYLPPKTELLSRFDYIPFDMHAGMLGYRVFLIREEDKAKFKQVRTLEDLRNFTGGFGSQWGDFKVFGLNDLPVVGAANTSVLMNMLQHGRFDYFHRGLHEAWAELAFETQQNAGLVVEESLALRYPFQVYFWFHPENQKLKQRFETGLILALQDGSYHRLFSEYFDDAVQKAGLDKRTIIDIEYPVSSEVSHWVSEVNHPPFWIETER